MKIMKKKKSSDTGAKKLIRPAVRLQLLRQDHADPVAGHEVRITPLEQPALARFPLRRRRQRSRRKVDGLEVGRHPHDEVADLRDVLAVGVVPGLQPLRAVRDLQADYRSGKTVDRGCNSTRFHSRRDVLAVDAEDETVVDRVRCRKGELQRNVIGVGRIAKDVVAVERDTIRREREQPFLPLFEVERDVDPALLENQGRCGG
jgi:hypothetical protein